ncbi:O-antigen ligase family protein [Thiocapsa bogorovii]|uniref:O-antigen ligase family protein n=1 Tax=Thiocapsa bogorovii TaxID=521689 RepID=UPI001E4C85A0|nr:O-antigen ligase family protein [Thiocapsa bogorovii]UHD18603.1 O-antigen ligase family protein [Thiocapsa bogorovii]
MPILSQPHRPTPRVPVADGWSRAGLFGLYVFAFFALLGITPATVGLILLTLIFLIRFDAWRELARDPVALIALTFGVFVATHSLIAYFLEPTPTLAQAVADNSTDWVKLLLFIPLAYWVAGRPDRVRLVLMLGLAGFTLATFRKIDWATFDAAFFSTRFDAYLPSIAFGMFAGLGALGLLATRRAFWIERDHPWQRWLATTLWAVWLLIMLEGLLLSQSRGSWLGFLGGLAILMLLEWRTRHATTATPPRRRWLAIVLGLGALGVILSSQYQTIEMRLTDQTDTLQQVISGDVTGVTSDPVGLRVNALLFTYEKWRERPWFGWGAGTSREWIATSGRPDTLMDNVEWLPHLHNAYAETLFQFGSVGLLLAVALVWALVRATRDACRAGRLPADLCRLFLVTLVFVLIWNLFNYRVVRSDWMVFWILLAGTAYSFRLAQLTQPAEDERG